MKREHQPHSSGLTLIEVLVSLLILGIALAGILPAAWDAIKSNALRREQVQARELAMEIYEEIKTMPRDLSLQGAATPPGQTNQPRAEFQSVLQYDRLIEVPPRDPLGNVILGNEAFTRTVALKYVDQLSTDLEVPPGSSHLLEIIVDIRKGDLSIDTLKFNRALR